MIYQLWVVSGLVSLVHQLLSYYCGKLRAVPSPEHFAHFPWPHPRDLTPTTSPSTSRQSTPLRRIPNGGDAPTRALLTRAHHRVWPTCLPCLPCVGKHDRLLRRRAAGRGRGQGVPYTMTVHIFFSRTYELRRMAGPLPAPLYEDDITTTPCEEVVLDLGLPPRELRSGGYVV